MLLLLISLLFSLLSPIHSATWYSVVFNGTSWKNATPSNTACVQDPYGNYVSQTFCQGTLPQPQFFPPCPYCATFDDVQLILNYESWYSQLWGSVYGQFGFASSNSDVMWSPLQMAKIWILGTLRNESTPIIASSPRYSAGGAFSCVNAISVGLQEGGTTGVDGTATYPYNDGAPRNIYDPAWNTGSTSDALCPAESGSTSDQCISGSIWQVSNAWVGSSCTACDAVGCQSLQNPLCACRVTFQFALMATQNQPCEGLVQNGATECTASQFYEAIDPKCFNGPFCLDSNGWNSPACYQMFRQVFSNEGLPYCRLAIEACSKARDQLLAAYQVAIQTNPSLSQDYKTLLKDDTSNTLIESFCPSNPGDYSTQPPQCTNK